MSMATCCLCGDECEDDLDKDMNTILCEDCEEEETHG